ncbi:MAG: endolytic transglycosylase MltG [Gammaproteobacteria bacterium]|nr:endolytic transglycosylase MltG [Gammaproteobacteria bacterium]
MNVKRTLPGVGVVLLALAAFAYAFWTQMQKALDAPVVLAEGATLFEIKHGQTLPRIADGLAAEGWLSRPIFFELEAARLGIAERLQAGIYEVRTGDTPRLLLGKFQRGEIKIFQVRFIEGTTFRELRKVLARQPALVATIAGLEDEEVMTKLGAPGTSPEGQFFPSTYFYPAGSKDLEILRTAHKRMQELLERYWAGRAGDLPFTEPEQALVVASIVEKETAKPEERPEIAGVFVRRLQQKMKLQTDPAVIYGLGPCFDGNLTRADLERDTPYNTYTRDGLPPTPIAMPGEDAIKAAVNPAPGNTLYFVARGDGSHEFSASLEDHIRAVHRFQQHKTESP